VALDKPKAVKLNILKLLQMIRFMSVTGKETQE